VKFQVRKVIEFTQEDVDAESPEEAIAAFDLRQASHRIVREGARVPRGPVGGSITDRELRPGRRFVARHKGKTYHAEVGADGLIRVEGIEGNFKSLSTAGSAICGHAVNGWRFFKDAPAEGAAEEPTPEPEPETEASPHPKKRAAGPPPEPTYLPPAPPKKAAKKRAKKATA